MKRLTKAEGVGNVVVEDAPIPEIGEREVLVKTRVSLISRGSEILRRYNRAEAIDPAIMGYICVGDVVEVGNRVSEFGVGDRVVVSAPHAEYAVGKVDGLDGRGVIEIPDGVSYEEGAFLTLLTAGVVWVGCSTMQDGDTVAILGQGLIGNLVMQAARHVRNARLFTVDALPNRVRLSRECGADVAIDASQDEPVARVLDLTGGKGADLVIDCVGGRAGVRSFTQAQEMSRRGGTIHLIGLYHDEPLLLDSGKIMGKRLIAGYYGERNIRESVEQARQLLASGAVTVQPLISHRIPFDRAKEAYDLLADRLGEAFGVLLTWPR